MQLNISSFHGINAKAMATDLETELQKIRDRLTKPIVLVGLMGAGKTKMGQMLAEALGWPFVDADHVIERRAGKTVSDIFAQDGEAAFRALEREAIAALLAGELCVIATGGGAVMNRQTADLVWSESVCVWIDADLDILVERTGRNNKRPLLQNGDPREILKSLMDRRYPVYAMAPVHVKTSQAEASCNRDNIIKALAAFIKAQDTDSP